jgi:hypothetical protein
MNAIVVGAGLDGLSAAVRLAAGGVQVQLLCPDEAVNAEHRPITPEQDHHGKDRRPDFAPGAQWLTLPFVLMDLFAAAGSDSQTRAPLGSEGLAAADHHVSTGGDARGSGDLRRCA